jgi:chitodextrinase
MLRKRTLKGYISISLILLMLISIMDGVIVKAKYDKESANLNTIANNSNLLGTTNIEELTSQAADSLSLRLDETNEKGVLEEASTDSSLPTLNAVARDGQAPTAPAGLTSTLITSYTIDLSWTSSKDNVGVTGYDIFKGTSKIGSTAGATTYKVTGLSANTSYSFTVKAKDAAGNISTASNKLTVRTIAVDTQAPTAPTNLISPVKTSTTVSLSWVAATDNVGVSGYDIYRGTTKVGTTTGLTTYTATGLVANTSYSFTVKAKDAAGNVSAASNILTVRTSVRDTQVPTAPTGLTAELIAETSITLLWRASSDNIGVIGYDIYEGITKVGSTNGAITYTVSDLLPNTSYSFTVKAKDAEGNISAASSTLSVKTKINDTQAPTIPEGLEIAYSSSWSILLTWNPSTDDMGEVEYEVYCNGEIIGNAEYCSYSYNQLMPNNSYEFFIKARDAIGNVSAESNKLQLTTVNDDYGNDQYTKPGTLVIGQEINGEINFNGDADAFKFTVEKSGEYIIRSIGEEEMYGYLIYDNGYKTMRSNYPDNQKYINMTVWLNAGDNCILEASHYYSNCTGKYGLLVRLKDTNPPSAPLNLKASNITTSSVALAWDSAQDDFGVIAYDIYSGDRLVTSVNGTSCAINGLSSNTTYSYLVKARDDFKNVSVSSNVVIITTSKDNEAPTAPMDLAEISKTDVSVTFSWCASTDNVGVAEYEIYCGLEKVGLSKETTYTLSGLTTNTTYLITIKAKDAVGNLSVLSSELYVTTNPDSQQPTIPTALTITEKTETTLTIRWNASTDNVGGIEYEIYNGLERVGLSKDTTYTLTGLTPDTTYLITIKAKDTEGNLSEASNELVATTNKDTIAPLSPTEVSVSEVTFTEAILTWTAATDNVGVTEYEIYNGTTKVGSTPGTVTSYNSIGLTPNASYSFSVKAKDAAGNVSLSSNAVTFTTEYNIINNDFILASDEVFQGLHISNGIINLNGHKLTVEGNLTQDGGTLYLNGGSLLVKGNYISSETSSIEMIDDNDHLDIDGNWDYYGNESGEFSAGVIYLAGNFTDYSKNSFTASGTHRMVLTGSSEQSFINKNVESFFDVGQRLPIKYIEFELFNIAGRFSILDFSRALSVKCNSISANKFIGCEKLNFSLEKFNFFSADFELNKDTTFDLAYDLCAYRANLNLNGHKLSIINNGESLSYDNPSVDACFGDGNLTLNGGTLKVDGAMWFGGYNSEPKLDLSGGNVYIKNTLHLHDNALLVMQTDKDYLYAKELMVGVSINGSSHIDETGYLTAGVIELGTGIKMFCNDYYKEEFPKFVTTGNHITIIHNDDGNGRIEMNRVSMLNTVVITSPLDTYYTLISVRKGTIVPPVNGGTRVPWNNLIQDYERPIQATDVTDTSITWTIAGVNGDYTIRIINSIGALIYEGPLSSNGSYTANELTPSTWYYAVVNDSSGTKYASDFTSTKEEVKIDDGTNKIKQGLFELGYIDAYTDYDIAVDKFVSEYYDGGVSLKSIYDRLIESSKASVLLDWINRALGGTISKRNDTPVSAVEVTSVNATAISLKVVNGSESYYVMIFDDLVTVYDGTLNADGSLTVEELKPNTKYHAIFMDSIGNKIEAIDVTTTQGTDIDYMKYNLKQEMIKILNSYPNYHLSNLQRFDEVKNIFFIWHAEYHPRQYLGYTYDALLYDYKLKALSHWIDMLNQGYDIGVFGSSLLPEEYYANIPDRPKEDTSVVGVRIDSENKYDSILAFNYYFKYLFPIQAFLEVNYFNYKEEIARVGFQQWARLVYGSSAQEREEEKNVGIFVGLTLVFPAKTAYDTVQGIYSVLKDPALLKEFGVFLFKATYNAEYRDALVTMVDQSIQEWFNAYESDEPYEQGLMIGQLTGQVLSAAIGVGQTAEGIKNFVKSGGFAAAFKGAAQIIKRIKDIVKYSAAELVYQIKRVEEITPELAWVIAKLPDGTEMKVGINFSIDIPENMRPKVTKVLTAIKNGWFDADTADQLKRILKGSTLDDILELGEDAMPYLKETLKKVDDLGRKFTVKSSNVGTTTDVLPDDLASIINSTIMDKQMTLEQLEEMSKMTESTVKSGRVGEIYTENIAKDTLGLKNVERVQKQFTYNGQTYKVDVLGETIDNKVVVFEARNYHDGSFYYWIDNPNNFDDAISRDIERFRATIETYSKEGKKVIPTYIFTDNTYIDTIGQKIIDEFAEEGLSVSIIHWNP